ncbi:MAG: hypothetical protein ACKOPE_06525 [Novosphingobium sp.]
MATFALASSLSARPSSSPSEEGDAQRLELQCWGGGSANKVTASNSYSNGYASGTYQDSSGNFGTFSGAGNSNSTVYGHRSQAFDDQVNLYIEGGQGRLRMPRTMLPPIHGGEDGWFKLKSIQIKENEITASVAVNLMNNPKVRVDRYSGAISISGKAGDYVGRCRRVEPQQERKQF